MFSVIRTVPKQQQSTPEGETGKNNAHCTMQSFHQRRILLILAVVLVVLYMFPVTSYLGRSFVSRPDAVGSDQRDVFTDFVVDTKGCRIPDLNPSDKYIRKVVDRYRPLRCGPNLDQILLRHNSTHVWVDEENAKQILKDQRSNLSCCYQSFSRAEHIPAIILQPCLNFTNAVAVYEHDEFVQIVCYVGPKTVDEKFLLLAPKKAFAGPIILRTTRARRVNKTYNVIVMGIDSVSRLNFHRTMPKTLSFIQKLGGVELLGYNSMGYSTLNQTVPLLTGYYLESLKRKCVQGHPTLDHCPFVWKKFKAAGYYTAFGEDTPLYKGSLSLGRGFQRQPTDYYTHMFMRTMYKYYGIEKREYRPHCMRDGYSFEHILRYIETLTSTLRLHRLFGFFWEAETSHDFFSDAMLMDDGYNRLLERLNDTGYLDETVVILTSDHGIRYTYGSIRHASRWLLEQKLPFAYILAPPAFREQYATAYKNLQRNSRRLTTAFDLYQTLLDLAKPHRILDESLRSRNIVDNRTEMQRGISLFQPIPEARTCESAGIEDQWCACDRYQSEILSVKSLEASQVAAAATEFLNKLLEKASECAQLHVARVLMASLLSDDKGRQRVRVTWRAKPGNGEFEAQLSREAFGPWHVVGSVVRLNHYRGQSECVRDTKPHLALYCFCI